MPVCCNGSKKKKTLYFLLFSTPKKNKQVYRVTALSPRLSVKNNTRVLSPCEKNARAPFPFPPFPLPFGVRIGKEVIVACKLISCPPTSMESPCEAGTSPNTIPWLRRMPRGSSASGGGVASAAIIVYGRGTIARRAEMKRRDLMSSSHVRKKWK